MQKYSTNLTESQYDAIIAIIGDKRKHDLRNVELSAL
jgi:hypothetical protein